MAARKTINVEELKGAVNLLLKDGQHQSEEFRLGAASVLEHVLEVTGNYKGFHYTDETAERTAEGYLVPGTYDESRRIYY